MNLTKTFGIIALLMVTAFPAIAQPYTLDKKIKPTELKLEADTRKGHEGEMGIVYFNRVTDSTMYHYVTGHTMFQMLDVLVTSVDGSPLKVSLNQDIWNDENNKKNTASSADNMASFKLRAEGKFGIKIETDNPNNSLYSIAVIASPEKKGYLGNVFRKIKDNEIEAGGSGGGGSEGGGNTMLYILLGVAILVIGLLAGKLMGRKGKSASMILWFLLAVPIGALAQSTSGTFLTMEQFEEYKSGVESTQQNILRKLEILESERGAINSTITDMNTKVTQIRSTWNDLKSLYTNYTGLSSCINSTPPAGSPSVPSICTDLFLDENGELVENEDSECASCFLEILAGIL